jgi:hypothetical protein
MVIETVSAFFPTRRSLLLGISTAFSFLSMFITSYHQINQISIISNLYIPFSPRYSANDFPVFEDFVNGFGPISPFLPLLNRQFMPTTLLTARMKLM